MRIAGSGTARYATADVIAFKNNHTIISEVKTVSKPPVDVKNSSKQLRKIAERVSQDGMLRSFSIVFILDFVDEPGMRYCEMYEKSIGNRDNYERLHRLLK